MSHVDCGECNGYGSFDYYDNVLDRWDRRDCDKCGGSGSIVCPECNGDGFIALAHMHYDSCDRCKGEP